MINTQLTYIFIDEFINNFERFSSHLEVLKDFFYYSFYSF